MSVTTLKYDIDTFSFQSQGQYASADTEIKEFSAFPFSSFFLVEILLSHQHGN